MSQIILQEVQKGAGWGSPGQVRKPQALNKHCFVKVSTWKGRGFRGGRPLLGHIYVMFHSHLFYWFPVCQAGCFELVENLLLTMNRGLSLWRRRDHAKFPIHSQESQRGVLVLVKCIPGREKVPSANKWCQRTPTPSISESNAIPLLWC